MSTKPPSIAVTLPRVLLWLMGTIGLGVFLGVPFYANNYAVGTSREYREKCDAEFGQNARVGIVVAAICLAGLAASSGRAGEPR